MLPNAKIYIAGHKGLVGSALLRLLQEKGFTNIITRSTKELDLRDQLATAQFFETEQPEYVFLAAAKVGGILANNKYSGQFIYDNILIQTNVIHQAYRNNVKKLLFLGSSCIYPKMAQQPIVEESLMNGNLEPTNSAYAIAKIAGIEMCQSYNKQYGSNFISVMPTNLYGPNDHYDLEKSHVLPALLRKFHEAKINNESNVTIWGTGEPMREFLHVDDCAKACLFLMQEYNLPDIINIGTGEDCKIKDLAQTIKSVVGFEGDLVFDESKPDGTPRKLLNVNRLKALGWAPEYSLEQGLEMTYKDFAANYNYYCFEHKKESLQTLNV